MVWFGSERKGRLGTGEWGLEAGGLRLEVKAGGGGWRLEATVSW